MPKEFEKLGPNLGSGTTETLFRQHAEQPGMGFIVEPILARPGYFPGVKVVVGQLQPAGAGLAKQPPVSVQGRVEARFEHSFGGGRRCSKL